MPEDRIICCSHCGARCRVAGEDAPSPLICQTCSRPITIPRCGAPDSLTVTPSVGVCGMQDPVLAQPPLPPAEMQPGDEIGSYTITCRIGKGGMGTVYRARHTKSGKEVAIKSLTLGDADLPTTEHTRRFLREARLAAAIRHPNVVQVIGFIQKGGNYHIIQEFVGGGSIKSLLLQAGTLPERRALEIALGTALALAEAAKVRIVHRDIKPDNIMLAEDGTPKLADLGLATQTHDGGGMLALEQLGADELFALGSRDTGLSLTMSNMAMGTPAYMAPEQAVDSRTVDARADVYSLGATLYHMLCGDPPFVGQNLREILSKHRHAPIPDPRQKRPEITGATAAIIIRCLAKRPEDRFQNAAELAQALTAHLQTMPAAVTGAGAGRAVHNLEQPSLPLQAESATPSGASARGKAETNTIASGLNAADPQRTQFRPAGWSATQTIPAQALKPPLRERLGLHFSKVGSRENITFLIAVALALCVMYLMYYWSESSKRQKELLAPQQPQIRQINQMEEFNAPPQPGLRRD